jgi:hypothetical protein
LIWVKGSQFARVDLDQNGRVLPSVFFGRQRKEGVLSPFNAVVWLDHAEARIFLFGPSDPQRAGYHQAHQISSLPYRAGHIDAGHVHADPGYFVRIGKALEGFSKLLVLGPGSAKLEFISHLQQHAPELARGLVGVETIDYPISRDIAFVAARYFPTTPKGGRALSDALQAIPA